MSVRLAEMLTRCARSCLLFPSTSAITGVRWQYGQKKKAHADDDRWQGRFGSDDSNEHQLVTSAAARLLNEVPPDDRNSETFRTALGMFLVNNEQRRGHVEFIEAALKHVEAFGVHRDLKTYKALMDIFPKGKMIPKNSLQRVFRHFLKQQNCAVEILDTMEYWGVLPDKEIHEQVLNAFGEWSDPDRKLKFQGYWLMKFKYANPFDVPHVSDMPQSAIEIAKIAVKTMSRDPATEISIWSTRGLTPSEDTWIVSGQSPLQRYLIEKYEGDDALRLQGPFRVWVRDWCVDYMQLIGPPSRDAAGGVSVFADDYMTDDSIESWRRWVDMRRYGNRTAAAGGHAVTTKRVPLIHEQPNETIYALACSGTSSKTSAAAWLSLLQRHCAKLAELPVLIEMQSRAAGTEVATVNSGNWSDDKLE